MIKRDPHHLSWPITACVLAAAWLVSSPASSATEQAASPPNIVLVLLDNVGQEWFGCYGSEEGCTPQMDKLAQEGLRFENCYSPPRCSNSRIELLTGRYPFRSGITVHHDAALYGGGGLDPAREIVVAQLLRRAGYATGIVGKWQLNNLYEEPDALRRHGFDEQLVSPESLDRDRVSSERYQKFREAAAAGSIEGTLQITSNESESRYWDPVLLREGVREVDRGKYGPDVMQTYALDFVRRHRDQPFLFYPIVLAHGQSIADPVVPTPLNRDPKQSLKGNYSDMVRYADRLIGQLAAEISQLGLGGRTILIVAADNGTDATLTARCRGQMVKGDLYRMTETGSNVPLFVHCPKLVPGGRTCALTDFSDIFPTICELAGVSIPPELVLDGRSCAGVLLDRPGATSPRQWIFNQEYTRRVVRDERYKLYSTGEFYDLAHDRQEQRNLAANTDAEVVAARNKLTQVLQSLPADAAPPFPLRSQVAFKLRKQAPVSVPPGKH